MRRKSGLAAELLLLFMPNPYRNKFVIALLSAFFVFLFGTNAAFASRLDRHVSYRTHLGYDLDGDRIPETASIRQNGELYQLNIHFTTGRPKVHLTTYVNEASAGLSVESADVNNDNKGDLVLVSATSTRPIAVWLNQGKSKFQRVSAWSYGVGRNTGPEYRHPQTVQPEPVGNIPVDPLPDATITARYFNIGQNLIALLCSEPETLPARSILRQVPPRGPPTTRA